VGEEHVQVETRINLLKDWFYVNDNTYLSGLLHPTLELHQVSAF
jgi:hypothetical protein